MTEFFICILIMVIVETYQDYLGYLKDEYRDTGFVIWFRITLWSIIIYLFYRVIFYLLDLGIKYVLSL